MSVTQLGFNIFGIVLLVDRVTHQPAGPLWPGLVIAAAASFGLAYLLAMSRLEAIRDAARRGDLGHPNSLADGGSHGR